MELSWMDMITLHSIVIHCASQSNVKASAWRLAMLCPHPLAFVIAKIFIIVVLTKKMLYFSYATPKIILHWSDIMQAKPYIRECKIEAMVDPGIKGQYCSEAMWRVLEVASVCTEPFSTFRPSMEDVLRELEDALIIENNASEYMRSIESTGTRVQSLCPLTGRFLHQVQRESTR